MKVFVVQSNDGRWLRKGRRNASFALTRHTIGRQCYANFTTAEAEMLFARKSLAGSKARTSGLLALAVMEVEI